MTCAGCDKPITQANVDYCIGRLHMKAAYCYDCQMRLDVYRGSGIIPGGGNRGAKGTSKTVNTTPNEVLVHTLHTIKTTRFCRENIRFLINLVNDLQSKLPPEMFEQVLAAKVEWEGRYSEWATR